MASCPGSHPASKWRRPNWSPRLRLSHTQPCLPGFSLDLSPRRGELQRTHPPAGDGGRSRDGGRERGHRAAGERGGERRGEPQLCPGCADPQGSPQHLGDAGGEEVRAGAHQPGGLGSPLCGHRSPGLEGSVGGRREEPKAPASSRPRVKHSEAWAGTGESTISSKRRGPGKREWAVRGTHARSEISTPMFLRPEKETEVR